jgi:hypothetical protein
MNAWGSPQWVRRRHFFDKGADLLIERWTTAWLGFRTAGPSSAKPVAMPPDDGVRLDEHQRRALVPPRSGQSDPKQSVPCLKVRALGRAFHRRQLLPQRQILQDQLPMSTERQRQRAADHDEQLQHASIVSGVGPKINGDEFWRGSTPRRSR